MSGAATAIRTIRSAAVTVLNSPTATLIWDISPYPAAAHARRKRSAVMLKEHQSGPRVEPVIVRARPGLPGGPVLDEVSGHVAPGGGRLDAKCRESPDDDLAPAVGKLICHDHEDDVVPLIQAIGNPLIRRAFHVSRFRGQDVPDADDLVIPELQFIEIVRGATAIQREGAIISGLAVN